MKPTKRIMKCIPAPKRELTKKEILVRLKALLKKVKKIHYLLTRRK